jgi:hypothetical protein
VACEARVERSWALVSHQTQAQITLNETKNLERKLKVFVIVYVSSVMLYFSPVYFSAKVTETTEVISLSMLLVSNAP